MTERTYPNQAEEALQRARGDEPTETCRALLLEIADYLTVARPRDGMYEASIAYLASARAQRRFHTDSERVAEATRQVYGHAPRVYPTETRGEYALRLRAAAQA